MNRYEYLLKELDKRGFDSSDIFSQAAGAIRQLMADVGGGDTAITQLEQEVEHLRNQIRQMELDEADVIERGIAESLGEKPLAEIYDQSPADGITELEQEAL